MQLQLFYEYVELSKCLNFSKAAANLSLTQPVLSRHISELEKQLGAQLLVRDTRNVQLTEMGRIFAEGSRLMIERYEETLERIQSATTGIIGTLSIGYLHYAVGGLLSEFVLYFLNQYPKIHLEYFASELPELVYNLDNDVVEIGFTTSIFKANRAIYATYPFFEDPLCVLISPMHPFSKNKCLAIKDLSGEPIISLSRDYYPETDLYLRNLFSYNDSDYNCTIEVANIKSALLYVASGRGIMVIPDHLAKTEYPNVVKKQLSGPDCSLFINMVHKKDNNNPLIPIFVDYFQGFAELLEDMNPIVYKKEKRKCDSV